MCYYLNLAYKKTKQFHQKSMEDLIIPSLHFFEKIYPDPGIICKTY